MSGEGGKALSLLAVGERVGGCMNEIKLLFKQPAKITVMVRRPGFPDQDFMMTDDNMNELRAMIDRRDDQKTSP